MCPVYIRLYSRALRVHTDPAHSEKGPWGAPWLRWGSFLPHGPRPVSPSASVTPYLDYQTRASTQTVWERFALVSTPEKPSCNALALTLWVLRLSILLSGGHRTERRSRTENGTYQTPYQSAPMIGLVSGQFHSLVFPWRRWWWGDLHIRSGKGQHTCECECPLTWRTGPALLGITTHVPKDSARSPPFYTYQWDCAGPATHWKPSQAKRGLRDTWENPIPGLLTIAVWGLAPLRG